MIARVIACVLAFATVAAAEAIPKWRTPDGRLHFGDRPPAGSVLVETIEFTEAEAPAAEAAPEPAADDDLARAAAEGREIMRRRAAERAADRSRRAAERPEASDEPEQNLVVITSHDPFWWRRHRFRDFQFDRRDRRPGFGEAPRDFQVDRRDRRPGFGEAPRDFSGRPNPFGDVVRRRVPPARHDSHGGVVRREGGGQRTGDRSRSRRDSEWED